MAKKLSKVAKSTLAAALVTSAIVPVASANEATAIEVKEVIFKDANGKLVKIGYESYVDGIVDGLFNFSQGIAYLVDGKGNIYNYGDYISALVDNDFNTVAAYTDLESNYTPVTDLEVTEGKFENGVVVGDPTPSETEVTVQDVSAINPSTIAIELSDAVEEFDISTLSATPVLAFDKVESIEGNTVYVSLKTAAAFNTTYKVTVAEQGTYDVAFKGVNEYYRLDFSYDTADTNENGIVDIPATGASTIQVTAQVVDLEGNPVETEGVIRFTTTEGGIAQGEKTLQKGKASIQLTSEASLNESLFASVTAEIVGSSKLIGLKSSDIVEFKALDAEGEEVVVTAVDVVKVESAQADRFQVVLGKERPNLTAAQLTALKGAITITDGIKATPALTVKEVKQLSPKVLEVILDTEADSANYLTDNAKHTVAFGAVTNLITAKTLDFILTDTSKQFVLGVEAPDQETLLVKYSEPVAFFANADYFKTDANGNYIVDADDFLVRNTHVDNGTDGTNPLAAYFGNLYKNYAIDGVTLDATTQFTLSADRKTVKIELAKVDTIKEKETNLEIKNVGDWAGVVDPKNRISTQRIEFTATIDDSVPALSVVRHSPEQFLITVDKDVTLKTGTDLATALEARYGKVLDADQSAPLTGKIGDFEDVLAAELNTTGAGFTATGTPEVIYTAYDKNWNLVDPATDAFKYILVELAQDWTEILPGENHWVAAPNLQFKLAKDLLSSNLDNKNVAFDAKVSNERDRVSPQVAVDATGKKVFQQKNQTIEYTMSEPVQIVTGATAKDMNNESSSGVAITPNAEQAGSNSGAVQATEINFEKDGVVVPGVVTSLNPTDYDVVAHASFGGTTGDAALAAAVAAYNSAKGLTGDAALSHYGKWTVTITGTPDDFGNTMATEEFVDSYVVEEPVVGPVTPTTPLEIDPFVVYAQYYHSVETTVGTTPNPATAGSSDGEFDVIYVKFSEVMANTGANAVGDTTNYVLNGRTLADLGSSIEKGIAGVTTDWDGITIKLPKDTIGADANFVLTLASNMTAKDDAVKLRGENELNFVDTDLVNPTTETSVYNAGLLFTNSYNPAALTPAGELSALLVDVATPVAATVATFNATTGLAEDLEITFSLNDTPANSVATLEDDSAIALPLQIVVNGQVVTATATITGADVTIELTDADEIEALELEENDRVEVKVNGQTVLVTTATL